jgi:succinoglycan biosynthesis protein ExoM
MSPVPATVSSRASSQDLTLCVATLTRQRPLMLQRQLDSWAALKFPSNAKVFFLIVENDESSHAAHAVERFRGQVPIYECVYVLEPRLGIPFARNRAIAEMSALNGDLLIFADDDEVVASDWLTNLVEEYRRTGALLIGGPVMAAPPAPELPWLARQIFKGVDARYKRKARLAARRAENAASLTTIVTSNWLGHRDLFEKHNLRFDEALTATGGSDAQFDYEVRKRGLKKSWAKDASVTETIPLSRLSVGYQFRRARDQSIASFQRRFDRAPVRAIFLLPFELLLRLAFVIALSVALPLTGGRLLLDLARAAGWIVGRCAALMGGRSRLYETVTGE